MVTGVTSGVSSTPDVKIPAFSKSLRTLVGQLVSHVSKRHGKTMPVITMFFTDACFSVAPILLECRAIGGVFGGVLSHPRRPQAQARSCKLCEQELDLRLNRNAGKVANFAASDAFEFAILLCEVPTLM